MFFFFSPITYSKVSFAAFRRLRWRCSLFRDNGANNNLAAETPIVLRRVCRDGADDNAPNIIRRICERCSNSGAFQLNALGAVGRRSAAPRLQKD